MDINKIYKWLGSVEYNKLDTDSKKHYSLMISHCVFMDKIGSSGFNQNIIYKIKEIADKYDIPHLSEDHINGLKIYETISSGTCATNKKIIFL